jgi:hypothetical protein
VNRALVAVTLLATFCGPAQADPAAWRVTDGNGGEIWLLGSMHYLRAADYPLPDSVEALYGRADALVMELDLDDLDTAAQQSGVLGAALLPQGTVLEDVLDADVYALAATHARRAGIDLALLASFEPWLVAITLLDQGMNRLGYEPGRGLEQYFVGKARADGKEITGLESFAAQIGIFDRLPQAQQQALLEQTLQELDSAADAMEQLTAAWRGGRLDELTDELLEDFAEFPGLYETLVTNRNRQWLASLETYLRERRSYLVVVGALHLVGPDSVVELLRERGYTVTRTP